MFLNTLKNLKTQIKMSKNTLQYAIFATIIIGSLVVVLTQTQTIKPDIAQAQSTTSVFEKMEQIQIEISGLEKQDSDQDSSILKLQNEIKKAEGNKAQLKIKKDEQTSKLKTTAEECLTNPACALKYNAVKNSI
jgi:hypothetical protein